MNEGTSLDESFNLSEKVLLYISKNEPLDARKINELVKNSGIEEDRMKLNIERLKQAGLIDGFLRKGLGSDYFTHADSIKLTYSGMKEIDELLKRKQGVKGVEINFGLLKFKI